MHFTAPLEKLESNVWYYHITVPDEVAQAFLGEKDRRVICTLNDEVEFHCALMPRGDGRYFININKETRKQLGLRLGTPVTARLRPDDSEYGLPMPEELGELLAIDEEGSRCFHALTPGKQRNLIYIVGSPKRSDTRLRKALVVVDYLKASGGKLDFKALNEAFKEANRGGIG